MNTPQNRHNSGVFLALAPIMCQHRGNSCAEQADTFSPMGYLIPSTTFQSREVLKESFFHNPLDFPVLASIAWCQEVDMTAKKAKPIGVEEQLAALETMPLNALRTLWQQYFKASAPPHYQRTALARRVGYQIQVAAYGGLSKTARLQLKRLSRNPALKSPNKYSIPADTRITKTWRGREIVVVAEAEGRFVFEGRTYKSLSAIASELVGCRQSGNKFFGLNKKRYAL